MPSRSGTRPSTLLHMHARPAPKEGEGGWPKEPVCDMPPDMHAGVLRSAAAKGEL